MAYQNHPPLLFMKSRWSLQRHVEISPHREHHSLSHSHFQQGKTLLEIAQILVYAAISQHQNCIR